KYEFPGDDIPVVRGSAKQAMDGGGKDAKASESILKLMEQVDNYIPTPQRDVEKPFQMAVEDVFSISVRGTVGAGRVERGKEEGGRHTPFFNGYRPQFYFRTTDVTGVGTLPEGREMVMPGDNVDITVELITPIAMEKELRFAIREGGRTVGAGVVTDIVQ